MHVVKRMIRVLLNIKFVEKAFRKEEHPIIHSKWWLLYLIAILIRILELTSIFHEQLLNYILSETNYQRI